MAGFWHLSHHQIRDPNGAVYAGAKAYFYAADSLLPIVVYQDYGLGTAHPNPVQANAYGIFPPVFLDEEDGFYRQRITTTGGVIIPGTDVGTIPVIGPGDGGGGSEVPVDPNALFQTGDVIWLDVVGNRPGWVRDNGRNIGSATSGASERANADTEQLFGFLWQGFPDTVCPVVGGRGVSSAADWSANKTIGLPDKRGRSAFGLDDMGNSAASRLSGAPFTYGDAITAGGLGGEATHVLTTPEIPAHNHPIVDPGHKHVESTYIGGGSYLGLQQIASVAAADLAVINSTQTAVTNVTVSNTGGGGSHNNTPMFVLGTFYRKL